MKFLFLLFCLGIVAFGALGEYIGGRILLPAIGLTAPEYWTWFWFMFWACLFIIPLSLVGKLFD